MGAPDDNLTDGFGGVLGGICVLWVVFGGPEQDPGVYVEWFAQYW